jgi:diguanylate cyclase (GGDEF)-like protein/PAS domain S-box-containing protein
MPAMHGVEASVATYPELLELVYPADRGSFDATWRQLAERGGSATCSYRPLLGGRTLQARARLVTVGGTQLVVGSTRIGEEPDADERRFSHLFRNFPVGICLLDDSGEFVEVNEMFCDMLGFSREQLIGTAYAQIVHPDEVVEANDTRLEVIAQGRPVVHTERRLIRSDGSVLWARFNTRRFDDSGQPFSLAALEDITARKEAEARLIALALHDSLTGLPNRRLLLDRLEQALARSRRDGQDVAVLFLDLDSVKRVNDSLGHEAGDQLLIEVAKNLTAVVRDVDTVARLGGDEFVLVCEQVSGREELVALAQRVLDAVRIPVDVGGETVVVTASIGVVTPASPSDRPQDLLRAADAAMYEAKNGGKARYIIDFHQPDVSEEGALLLEAELREAVEQGQLVLHFQPITTLDGRVQSFEALLRWRHPSRGLLGPTEFWAALSHVDGAGMITQWVIQSALDAASGWPPGMGVNVNVGVDRLAAPGFAASVAAALNASGVAATRLTLEILEDQLADTPAVAEEVQGLKGLGVRLAIDDFGTGYSSLAYLKRLPISQIKIDRSFISKIDVDPDDASIVKAVLDACRSTGRQSVAEGVETMLQLQILRKLGCDSIQGALTGMPAPLELLEPLIRAGRFILP